MKSYLILLIAFLDSFATTSKPEKRNNSYEPYMKIRNGRALIMKVPDFNNVQLYRDDLIVEKVMCPAETNEDISIMEEISQYNYRFKYCLFKKTIEKIDDRKCKKEVKPVFQKLMGSDKRCGISNQQSIYSFTYQECAVEALSEFREEKNRNISNSTKYLRQGWYTYEICYDTVEKQVIWIKHHIQTPQLFQNPHMKNLQLTETEISTRSYFMNEDLFLTLHKRFQSEKKKNTSKPGNFRMVPQPLVPPAHYALPMSKKTTYHYINMAPLWENLVPLVTAIDEGIKKAQMKLESQNPSSYSDIIIFTKVAQPNKADTSANKWFNLLLFEGNIWYKFIYMIKNRSAVLIIIHNTPENPPESSKGCVVGKDEKCEFKKWSKDEEIRQRITSKEKQYAYCCEVSLKDIIDIFPYRFAINQYFEIEKLIIED